MTQRGQSSRTMPALHASCLLLCPSRHFLAHVLKPKREGPAVWSGWGSRFSAWKQLELAAWQWTGRVGRRVVPTTLSVRRP